MLKKIAKAGALLFVVGALLAAAAPYIGVAVGLAATAAEAGAVLGNSANPLWMGAFFGAFGAIDAAVRPVFDRLFDGRDAAAPAAAADSEAARPRSMQPAVTPAPALESCCSTHRDALAARRPDPAGPALRL